MRSFFKSYRMFSRKILLFFLLLCTRASFAQVFVVQFPPSDKQESFTGDVYVYLSKSDKEPIFGDNFPIPDPVLKISVTHLSAGAVVTLSGKTPGSYPVPVTELERGDYFAQAIFDRANGFTTDRELTDKAGNLFSDPVRVVFSHDLTRQYTLTIKNRVPEKTFTETTNTKEVKLYSALLSRFHHKDIYIKGAVVLPDTLLKNPDAHLPLCINISGFGGNYRRFSGNTKSEEEMTGEKDFIYVFLDGNCSNGHTVYANSDNNGPWGDALVKEFIPEVEKRFSANGFRYVFGHSSGGWAALYLQVMYPDFFQACWASSPDSYDFKSIAGLNIYEPGGNVYYDQDSNLRPSVLLGGSIPLAYVKPMAEWESIVPGGQFNSFNAVFSARAPNGGYERLWDMQTGQVRPEVVNQWKRYDLSDYIQQNWNRLAPKLSGKIFITVGDADNFLLTGASRLFLQDIRNSGIPVEVRFYSGDHFTVLTGPVLEDARKELESNYKKWEVIYADHK